MCHNTQITMQLSQLSKQRPANDATSLIGVWIYLNLKSRAQKLTHGLPVVGLLLVVPIFAVGGSHLRQLASRSVPIDFA